MERLIIPDPIISVSPEKQEALGKFDENFLQQFKESPFTPSNLFSAELTEGEKLIRANFALGKIGDDIIEGYNDMVLNQIPSRLRVPFFQKDQGDVSLKVWIDEVTFVPPSVQLEDGTIDRMYPIYARTFNRTYESEILGKVFLERKVGGEIIKQESERFSIGHIPVMIGSVLDNIENMNISDRDKLELYGECPDDAQGYFIISGIEYVVMIQQQLRYNTLLVIPRKSKKKYKGVGKTAEEEELAQKERKKQTNNFFYEAKFKSFTLNKTYMMKIFADNDGILLMSTDNIPRKSKKTIVEGFSVYHVMRILGGRKFRSNADVSNFIIGLVMPDEKIRSAVRTFLSASENEQFKYNYSFVNPDTFNGAPDVMASISKKFAFISNLVKREVFPYVNEVNNANKLILLAISVLRYAYVELNIVKANDIDSWSSSQATSPAMSIYMFFNQIWNDRTSSRQQISNTIEREIYDITAERIATSFVQFSKNFLSQSFSKGFKKSSFRIRNNQESDNVTQVMIRKSTLSAKAHINRIVIRAEKRGKMVNKRQVHMSQLGYVCPSDAQEGEKCGLTKSKAVTARISVGRDPQIIVEYLLEKYIHSVQGEGHRPILLNYDLVGWGFPTVITRAIQQGRRSGKLPADVSVIYDLGVVYILSMPGRLVRPLLVVENGKLVIEEKNLWGKDFQTLIREGAVEYLDAWEQESGLISSNVDDVKDSSLRLTLIAEHMKVLTEENQKIELRRRAEREMYTHCELDPSAILGIGASIIPLANHNQGPRNSYQCNMGYQALGIYASNHYYRLDAQAKILAFPARPIMETHMMDVFGLRDLPQGRMVNLAIMPFQGLNQEDAIIIRKESVEMGLFSSIVYHSVTLVLEQGSNEKFTNPLGELKNFSLAGKMVNPYRHLNLEGIPYYDSVLKENDCIIGAVRITVNQQTNEKIVEDISIYADKDWDGYVVDRVEVGINGEGKSICKVKGRKFKYFEQGDKIASRHAQKSIGVIIPGIDMPFSDSTGMVPDLIMNSLAIPSRMTIGHIFEIVASRYGAMVNSYINGSSWSDFSIDKFKRLLTMFGYSSSGKDIFYSGTTGEMIQGYVFTGPCYYQALYHQVADKIQARQTGMLNRTTKQAISGRSRGGGIKTGTMENSAIMAHGGINASIDRLTSSCGFQNPIICQKCGTDVTKTITIYNSQKIVCPRCEGEGEFAVCHQKTTAGVLGDILSIGGIKSLYFGRIVPNIRQEIQ